VCHSGLLTRWVKVSGDAAKIKAEYQGMGKENSVISALIQRDIYIPENTLIARQVISTRNADGPLERYGTTLLPGGYLSVDCECGGGYRGRQRVTMRQHE